MGLGGVSGMITSIKNNSRKNKKTVFDTYTPSDKKSQPIKSKSISEEDLDKIKNKIIAENNSILKKRIILFGSIITIITGGAIKLIFY